MLYFLPGAKALHPGLLAQHGLDSLLASPQSRETSQGPDGAGLLVCDQQYKSSYLRHDSHQQSWSRRYGYDSQVGTWHDQPPDPSALAKPDQIDGGHVRLLDGNQWLIPTLRRWQCDETNIEYRCMLPRVMRQSPDTGDYILDQVIPHYRELWDTACTIADELFAQLQESTTAHVPYDEFIAFAHRLLAVNYRVDPSVISHLGLLSQDIAETIIGIALDWDTLRDHLKKELGRRASGGTTSAAG
jgi:hypothetical protein